MAAEPTRLQRIGEEIWLIDGEVVSFYGFPYPTRSVVVRLATGELWVWSPVALTPALAHEVAALGPVRHLVSPNKIHHLYLAEWREAFAGTLLWGPRSTARKRRDLELEAPLTDSAPSAWAGQIDQFWFRGSPLLDEVVFVHRASRTAVLADLSENFGAAFLNAHWSAWQRPIAQLWKITEPWGLAPLEWRLSWWRRAGARACRERLLACEPLRVVMAHGEWQRDGGRAYLERVLGWLG